MCTLTLTLLTPSIVFLFSKYFKEREECYATQNVKGGQVSLKTAQSPECPVPGQVGWGALRSLCPQSEHGSVFCMGWQDRVPPEGSSLDKSFHAEGVLGRLPSSPGGATSSFYSCEKQRLVRPEPPYTCYACLCLSQSTETLHRTTSLGPP